MLELAGRVPDRRRGRVEVRVLNKLTSSALLLLLLGCASSGGSGSGSSLSSGAVTRADLLETDQATLYDAIQRLRPRWLRARGTDFSGQSLVAHVFVDGSPRGEISVLRQIRVVDITDVNFLSATDAATRYGTRVGIGGAILVGTRGAAVSDIRQIEIQRSRVGNKLRVFALTVGLAFVALVTGKMVACMRDDCKLGSS